MTERATISLKALEGLYAVATGQLTHVNNGSCPDILEGALIRDDECLACKMLDAVDIQMREAGVALPAQVTSASV
ncbi:hypothetical protein [Pseudomonas koreensis]|jgi:hypothetical protein|uniref:hypothetical protein n=1 Tax=Pseudomonas koreensis TaxID=198620 RepID=UPI001B331BAE|nr:hypothetical protein [Pseudomonas koreensis]MBP3998290.1 hypothetical protein [Pseudomonas koreensis]